MSSRMKTLTFLCLVCLLTSCNPTPTPTENDTIQLIRTPVQLKPVGFHFETALPPTIVPITPVPVKPELYADFSCPSGAEAGEQIGRLLHVIVHNRGQPSPGFFIDLVLSTDTSVPIQYAMASDDFTEDMLLKGGRERITSLGSNTSIEVQLPEALALPQNLPDGNYYLAVVVDPGQDVDELNEDNNVVLCSMQICPITASMLYLTLLEFGGSISGFGHMTIAWDWSEGLLPQSLLITVYRNEGGQWVNVMPSQEPYEVQSPESTKQADVTIWRTWKGDYRIVFNASYSCNREREFAFELTIP